MYQVQESNIASKEKSVSPFLRGLIPIACAVSFALYLTFSHGLRYLIKGWNYHTELFKMVFPRGLLEGLLQHIPLFPNISIGYNGLLILGFLSTCVSSAWLAHSLLGGRRSELGPHLILFSLAVAIVPSLLLAMFFWPDGRGNLTLELAFYASLLIAIVLGYLKLKLFHWKKPSQLKTKYKDQGAIGLAWAFILPLVVLFGFAYLIGAVSIVGFGSDSLAYHLPLAASWFHNGSITRGANIQFYYPGNSDLMLRWCFVGGSEKFVFLLSFFSAILGSYMIYKLGRLIGQGRQPALVAACCVATFPVIPFLATTAYTDTMSALFLLLSVFFLIQWIQTNSVTNSHLLCAGLAAGLAAGSKMNMLTSAFAISVVAMVAVLRSRKVCINTGPYVEDVGLNWPWLLRQAGVFFSAALLGGGYWYLRNWIEQGNPFYPVAMLGLPGLELKTILPIHLEYLGSTWKRFLYPWTELTYYSPYDDGVGAVAAGIAIPALLLWPFLRYRTKGVKRIGSGVIYSIACISLLLFAWSDIMWMRHGIFPIMLCFVLVGELWLVMPSIWLRTVTFVAFLTMTVAITQSLAGGYMYEYLRNNETRAERLHVPALVDFLPPTRIFNAAASFHTYGLMGRDYRHEVITIYSEAKPEDVLPFDPTHILLTKAQEEMFRAKLPLERVGSEMKGTDPVSLWKIIRAPQNAQ